MAQSNGDEELRQALIEKYMEVAASFYFEGSDIETERDEYAPEFADEIMQLILADRKQHELEARIDELDRLIDIESKTFNRWSQKDIANFFNVVGKRYRSLEAERSSHDSIVQ